jgi:hypothetical protein
MTVTMIREVEDGNRFIPAPQVAESWKKAHANSRAANAVKFDNPNYKPEAGMKYLDEHFQMFDPKVAKAMIDDAKAKGIKIPMSLIAKAQKAGIAANACARNDKYEWEVGDKVQIKKTGETGIVKRVYFDGSVTVIRDSGAVIIVNPADLTYMGWVPKKDWPFTNSRAANAVVTNSAASDSGRKALSEGWGEGRLVTWEREVVSGKQNKESIEKQIRSLESTLPRCSPEWVQKTKDAIVYMKEFAAKHGIKVNANSRACNAKFKVGDKVKHKTNGLTGIVEGRATEPGNYNVRSEGRVFMWDEDDLVLANSRACNAVTRNARAFDKGGRPVKEGDTIETPKGMAEVVAIKARPSGLKEVADYVGVTYTPGGRRVDEWLMADVHGTVRATLQNARACNAVSRNAVARNGEKRLRTAQDKNGKTIRVGDKVKIDDEPGYKKVASIWEYDGEGPYVLVEGSYHPLKSYLFVTKI